jgi:hypothetical protein
VVLDNHVSIVDVNVIRIKDDFGQATHINVVFVHQVIIVHVGRKKEFLVLFLEKLAFISS